MEKKMNNKGFSLVELIIVIAIMSILVGVLAPQFIKYVESSRRSNDIATAEEIRQAVLADMADDLDGKKYTNAAGTDVEFVGGTVAAADVCNGAKATSITESPVAEGAPCKGDKFKVTYNKTTGTCSVKLGTFDLTTTQGAADYKASTATK